MEQKAKNTKAKATDRSDVVWNLWTRKKTTKSKKLIQDRRDYSAPRSL